MYILIIISIIIIIKHRYEIIEYIKKIKINENINYTNYYSKKDYLLTPTELKFYKLLKNITDKLGYSLFIQVPLYELVQHKRYTDFNKIRSKSIDFVITQKNCKILVCIELDDKTHNQYKRIQRDKFINKLFEDIGIKLIRVPVQNFYNVNELERKLLENI